MDGYLGILRSEEHGGEWDERRFRLAGDEERGVNARRTIIARQ